MRYLDRILALLLMAAFGWTVILHAADIPRRPTLISCYETDGRSIRTVYIEEGGSGFDPYPIEESYRMDGDDVVTIDHHIVLRKLGRHVFLPVMTR